MLYALFRMPDKTLLFCTSQKKRLFFSNMPNANLGKVVDILLINQGHIEEMNLCMKNEKIIFTNKQITFQNNDLKR